MYLSAMKLPVLCLLLACLAGCALSLKCFSCETCGLKIGSPMNCSEEQDICMKVVAGSAVIRKCESKSLCGLGKAQRAASKAWTKFKNLFKDVPDESVFTYCCDSSYCNPGSRSSPTLWGSVIVFVHLIFSLGFAKLWSP